MARGTRQTNARRAGDIEMDQRIGQRIKERRMLMGLSQTELGEGLGITYQQLQKYETGHNRIAAGRLYACTRLLDVPPEYFFEKLEASNSGTPDDTRSDEALKLTRAYYGISDPVERDHVRKLVVAIAAGKR